MLFRSGPVSWAPAGIAGPGGGYGGAQGPGQPGANIEIHVHGIPPRGDMSTAPPPLTLPAAPVNPVGGQK